MMSVTVGLFGLISIAYGDIFTCTEGSCVYDTISGEDTIICTDTALSCNITCATKDQCKPRNGQVFTIFSGAQTTYINCLHENSCAEMDLNIGVPNSFNENPVLLGYTEADFDGEKIATINCGGKLSCQKSIVQINGNFMQKVLFNSDGLEALKSGNVNVKLIDQQEFELNCGIDTTLKSCQDSNLFCRSGTQCSCLGPNCVSVSKMTETPTRMISIYVLILYKCVNTISE